MESEKENEAFLNQFGNNSQAEFTMPDGYFDEVQSEIQLRIKTEGSEEFSVPTGYFKEKQKANLKRSNVRKLMYFVSSSAAAVFIAFFVFTSKSAECKTFDCLLEETSITQEDLEYLEEYEEINLFDYEE